MKYLIIVFASVCCMRGATSAHLELALSLERAVQLTATGRIAEGLQEMSTQGTGNRSPREKAEETRKFRDALEEMRSLGNPRRVSRVSLLFFGDGFFRLRVLDRRGGGAVLWTFVGELDDDKWVVTSISMSGSADLPDILKELDAADYMKDAPKEP